MEKYISFYLLLTSAAISLALLSISFHRVFLPFDTQIFFFFFFFFLNGA